MLVQDGVCQTLHKADMPSLQTQKSIIILMSCLNGVTMARHGPILGQDEATGYRDSKYVPGLRGTISNSMTPARPKQLEESGVEGREMRRA